MGIYEDQLLKVIGILCKYSFYLTIANTIMGITLLIIGVRILKKLKEKK